MNMSPPGSPPASFDSSSYDDGSLPSGVKKTVITDGTGWEKPKDMYEVKVNITGKHGETVFDSNESEGQPRTYVVGSGLPCKGLNAALKNMKKGEKSTFVIEAAQGFGSEGLPDKNVPADSEITYEVELVDWHKVEDVSKTKNKSILVKVLVEGPDWDKPKDNDISFLRYRGRVVNEDTYFVVEGMGEGDEPVRTKTSSITPSGLLAAVKELKKGSKALITLKPEHAFGEAGIPDKAVPANATVEYEVELVDVHNVVDVSKDGGVLCETLNKISAEWKKPKETSKCVVSWKAAVAGSEPWVARQFEEVENRDVVIGSAGPDAVTDGLERALEQLVKGQRAYVTVKPEYAYGDAGLEAKVKPGETVEYRVELHSFEEAPSTYSMSAAEKKAYTEKIKEAGNIYFKAGQTRRALRRYEVALEPFEYIDSIKDEDEKKTAQELKAACLLNIAACHDKQGNWNQVMSKCNKVMELAVNHNKARFRRAKAYIQLGRLQEARSDLEKLLEVDPNDKAVVTMMGTVRKLQKDQDARAKQIFGKMFKSAESPTA